MKTSNFISFLGSQMSRCPVTGSRSFGLQPSQAAIPNSGAEFSEYGPTRWGIMGAGMISNDWSIALSTLNPREHKIVGIAARKLESAQAFAKGHNIPKSYGSYESLAQDPDVEVVYIATIHPEHLRLSKLALDNGKHVLCEKPLCMNVKETVELVNYARMKKLFLMEGVWSRFFPTYFKLRELIDAGTIGEVKQVIATIGPPFSDDPRGWRRNKDLGAGTVLQMGIYNTQFSTLVFKGLRPEKIVAAGHMDSNGADISSSATLIFPGGKTATLLTHSQVELPNEALAIGTKGMLKYPFPCWGPTKLVTPTDTIEFPLPIPDKKLNFWNTTGLRYQCKEVRRCILNGLTESPYMTLAETILVAEIQESIRKQIGVVYPTD